MKPTFPFSRFALIAIASLFLSLPAAAQEKKLTARDVPAAVIAAFKTAYPNATIRGYAREKENGKVYYEIESREGTTRRDILYNPDCTVFEIEESVDPGALPPAVSQAFKQRHPNAIITFAERTTSGDKVTYEIKAKQGRKRFTMEFDSDGKLVTKAPKA